MSMCTRRHIEEYVHAWAHMCICTWAHMRVYAYTHIHILGNQTKVGFWGFVSGESSDAVFQMANSNSRGCGENSMNKGYDW